MSAIPKRFKKATALLSLARSARTSAAQYSGDLLVVNLLVNLLPLGPPLAADAKAILKFKNVQGNKGLAKISNFRVVLFFQFLLREDLTLHLIG